MKKTTHIIMLAAAIVSLAACNKENEQPIAPEIKEIHLSFSSIRPSLEDAETKTAWNGETIKWSKGDAVRVGYTVNGTWQAAAAAASSEVKAKLYASSELNEDTDIANFNVSLSFTDTQNEGLSNPVYKFYAIYPSGLSGADFTNPPYVPITISSEQTPAASSFDKTVDVMYAASSEYPKIPSDRVVGLTWHRIVSHADISMKNLQLEDGETLESITVTAQAGADLVGSHTLNITNGKIALADGATAGNSVRVKADNLTLSNGAVEFWFTSLPFTATELTFTVKTDKYTYVRQFTGLNLVFKGNARNTLSVNMKKAQKFQDYEETFSAGIGEFTTTGDEGIWTASYYGGDHFMKGTSYINKTNTDGEGWLISPFLSIKSSESELSFNHAINAFFGTISDEATVWAREKGGEWTKLSITYPEIPTSGFSRFEATTTNLSSYNDKTIQIGFKYIGTSNTAGTWEVKDFKVTDCEVFYYPSFEFTSTTTKEVSFTASTVEFTYSAAHLTSEPTIAIKGDSDDIINGEPIIADGKVTVNIKANNDEVAKTATLVVTCKGVTGIPELVINQAKKENLVEKSVILDFSAQNYSNGTVVSLLTVDPVTASLEAGTNSNAPKYYNTGTAVRCYAGNTIALSSTKTIVKAEFTFASGGDTNEITSNVGTYTNGTWTGSTTSVTYTIGGTSGHRRIQQIKVTYMDEAGDEPTPQTPVITLSNLPTENISAEGDVVTITYQIENPVSGVTVSAAPASGASWVNTFDYDTDGAISFVVDPKTTTGTRTTTITVSYTGAESKTFEITQDGASSGDPTLVYTFATAKSTSNTAYASTYDVTINSVQWNVPGNQNFEGYVRIGGKSLSNENRVIAGGSISSDVDEIRINTNGVSNANLTVNSITVTAHSSLSDAKSGSNAYATFTTSDNMTFAKGTATTVTFTKTGTADCSGKYYRIVFNLTNSANTNYGLDVNSIEFYN